MNGMDDTDIPCPEVGDTLILIVVNERRQFDGYPRYHGLTATVEKVTPTGMLDLRFHPRGRDKDTVERTLKWDGAAAAEDSPVKRPTWRAVTRQHPLAATAPEQGAAAYREKVEERARRKEEQRRYFLSPEAEFNFDLTRREIETIIARLDPEADAALIDKFKTEITPEAEPW